MRIAMALLAAASLAFGSAACKKKEPAGDNVGQASGQATGSAMGSAVGAETGSAAGSGADTGSGSAAGAADGSAAMGSGAGSGEPTAMSRRGGNCPSLVAGSTTKAELKGGAIIVTITSDDKDAIASIQKRAEALVKERADGAPSGSGHDQKGTHGGGQGLCPVHLGEGGTATSKADKKGAVVTITPKDKPEALKAEIDARIIKAAEWLKANVQAGDQGTTGGVGGGKGEHGSNHSGEGDSKGKARKAGGGDGKGGGKGTGGGGGGGTGGGAGSGTTK